MPIEKLLKKFLSVALSCRYSSRIPFDLQFVHSLFWTCPWTNKTAKTRTLSGKPILKSTMSQATDKYVEMCEKYAARNVYAKRQTRICTTWPSFPLNCLLPVYYFYSKISSFTPVLSIRIVLDSCYLLFFYSEEYPTWLWRLSCVVNVTLNPSIKRPPIQNTKIFPIKPYNCDHLS